MIGIEFWRDIKVDIKRRTISQSFHEGKIPIDRIGEWSHVSEIARVKPFVLVIQYGVFVQDRFRRNIHGKLHYCGRVFFLRCHLAEKLDRGIRGSSNDMTAKFSYSYQKQQVMRDASGDCLLLRVLYKRCG